MAHLSRQRLCIVILTAYVALAVAFAEFFVFTNQEHDCLGAHCSICLQIEVAQRLLECLGGVCVIAALALHAHDLLKLTTRYPSPLAPLTPVLLKVRFNF
ncbi:MAG: hypothetical protein LBL45_08840 [Treponema sp.]|jgi:hypothetical protein|nr:hypothetical protein [Treponema sp.]